MNKQYEAMFLVSPTAGDGEKSLAPVRRVLDRAEAEVLVCKRWDERKLAYEIAGQKRGTYVLTYFRTDGARIVDIERDVQLSEEVLRVLILQAEDVTRERMDQPTPADAMRAFEESQKPAGAAASAEQKPASGQPKSAGGAETGASGGAAEAPKPVADATPADAAAGKDVAEKGEETPPVAPAEPK